MFLSTGVQKVNEVRDMNDAQSTLAFIRQARLKQIDLLRQYDELQDQIDAKVEVTPLRRPTRRKTISAENAAALIRSGGLHEHLSA